ncbi:hypothetical protein SAMN05421505_10828 [Sinosporangium album]|uniref:FtsH ternary system domain-containing protein n=2 Tax=Sinosporangium album TaxID=504805 RepID=A0A1G7X430_9ACTN|nr:hypothetical protein SAMN05421505_10828 [Sinosporangium album]
MLWAVTEAATRRDAPGHGDLSGAADLADPPEELRVSLGRLAAVTAARLRLGPPPLGDGPGGAVGPGAALLAAAVGARHHLAASVDVLNAARLPTAADGAAEAGGWELAVRHGVAEAALAVPDLDPDLADLLRDCSPLTALLDHPTPEGEREAELLLTRRLLHHPDGWRLAALALAEPPAGAAQAVWRSGLLSRCRRVNLAFVLDVYEMGLSLFAAEHRRRLRAARRLLSGAGRGRAVDPDAVAGTALWWRALAEIGKTNPRAIGRRRWITAEHAQGIELYRALRRWEAAS